MWPVCLAYFVHFQTSWLEKYARLRHLQFPFHLKIIRMSSLHGLTTASTDSKEFRLHKQRIHATLTFVLLNDLYDSYDLNSHMSENDVLLFLFIQFIQSDLLDMLLYMDKVGQ